MAMESDEGLQEFRWLDSDKRKKLDGFTVFGTGGGKDMKDANIAQKYTESLKSEPKYDLRKSLAWDSAFFTSPGFLEPEELFHTLNSSDNRNGCDILGHEQHQLLSAKFLESEMKSTTNECNIRKSLAWDSAFLTSQGVLNPEELSLVNKGFKKSEMHVLSGIEELCLSAQSSCTTDSDKSSLAGLEVELFEDVKAPMHHELSKPSGKVASSFKQGKCKDMQKVHSLKKMDGPPQLKAKSLPNSRKQTGNQSEKTAKEAPPKPPSRQYSAGSGEFDPSSSLKPPKIIGRVRSIQMAPSKRVSLVTNEVKGESKNVQATNGKSLIFSIKHNPGKTSSDFSSTPSSKSSLLSHPYSMTESRVICSPCSQLSTSRSPLKSSGRKCDSSNSNSSKYRLTNQIMAENYGHPTHSSSLKKSCPCISPSVFTDSYSSKSSTSTDHRCHGSMTSPKGICRQFSIDSDGSTPSDVERKHHDQINVRHDREGSLWPNPCAEGKGSNSVPFHGYIKPSGLRMPSPKIGYFDEDDSLVPAESEDWKSHSGVQNAVPKVGIGNRNLKGYAHRSRSGKVQTSQALKDIRQSTVPRTMKSNSLGLSHVSMAGSYSNCEEKSKDCLGKEAPECPEPLRNKMVQEGGQFFCLRDERLLQKEYNWDKTIHSEYEQHILCENEKENLTGFQNQLEALEVRTIDVSGDVVIELCARDGMVTGN